MTDNNARVGFWRPNPSDANTNPEDLSLPSPQPQAAPIPRAREFLEALGRVEGKAHRRRSRGWSLCRLCGRENGSDEFDYSGFTWPSGYAHYLEVHFVAPDADFARMVWRHGQITDPPASALPERGDRL